MFTRDATYLDPPEPPVIRCPTNPRSTGPRFPGDRDPVADPDIVGCGSTNVDGPDDEGFYDCLDCGIWFKADDQDEDDERDPDAENDRRADRELDREYE